MANINCRAENVLDELGIDTPDEIDIEAIAQYCGATVVYRELTGCEARIVGAGDRAVISVNVISPRSRQRFSAAHELGHWMLDRGRAVFACEETALVREWSAANPETRANGYASDLLLPVRMFKPLAHGKELTLATARELADRFQTSLTATTIRMVQHGSYPGMVICSSKKKREWFVRGPDVPAALWPAEAAGRDTVAYHILKGDAGPGSSFDVRSSAWFGHDQADRYWIREDAVRITPELVVSLLWWKDEQELVALDSDGDDSDADWEPRFR